ncbi:MAG: helix-turn-helix transcriptional regulator [Candidatus Gribaldobacteria bacterium]|nr:helix-turn-helix transcriptional regulator [Candidatus Gribaldobacteria bacterium]
MTTNYQQFKKKLLKDKKIKKAYDELGTEFSLIETVIEKRLEKGLSQQKLAQMIGTKQSAISRFEASGYNPTIAFLQKIAFAMGLNVKISLIEK